MSSPPPTKPPRGVKQGKETSGLLMSVIRTLSASETNELREKERAKLEKEYKKSDAKLDELVAAHASDIMEVMQKFSQTTAALSAWGTRCDAAVARLAACRSLLQLRRDDLTRLWADSRTHHHALQMLTDIERVVVSEREVHSAMSAGRVLGAAATLRGALQAAGSTLERVTALHHTRDHLESKKRELVDMIVKRLGHAVYRGDPAPLSRRPSRRRTALLLAELMKTEEVTEAYMQDITPEFESSLLEEDKTFETNVMISLEALGMLEQLKEGAENFKVQIQSELLELIDTISRRIIEEGDVEIEGDECEQDGDRPPPAGANETGRPLVRLIACLGDEFRAGASRNKRLLQLWRAALQRHQISDACLHSEQHYWSAVQQVLQLLLTEYLEIESVTQAARCAGAAAAAVGGAAADLRLADYFARRRPPRRRARLYTLPAPATGAPPPTSGRAPRYRPVCRAAPAHLHRLLPALQALCRDTEAATGGGECSLRAFITNYVREGEAERLAGAARGAIDAAMREPGAWREKAPPTGGATARGAHRLIFASCDAAWAAVCEAARAARRCGPCGGGAAARSAVVALAALAAHCRHAHDKLTPTPPHPSRAARWLSDDDIVRFLQSLPNWRVATCAEPVVEDKQLEQELKQAYEREAEILGSSLGDGAVERREIVADVSALAEVALLCETMDWLSANIKTLPQLLSGVKLSDKLLADVAAAACIFDEIQHKCLLFLHLEVRIQCFHYLGQEGEGAEQGAGGAARLAQALLALHELVAPVLAPRRLAYVMNGVGEMMSAGVILRWQWGAASSARLATLRHCLAALHLPHVGLHSAHNYLRLLAEGPQEIIDRIKEKGPEFSELEYLNAFKAIGAKRGLSQSDLKPYLKQLADALGTIGVTV